MTTAAIQSLRVVYSTREVAEGSYTYVLTNGWFIRREEREHRRSLGHRYELYVPAMPSARCLGGASTLAGALQVAVNLQQGQ